MEIMVVVNMTLMDLLQIQTPVTNLGYIWIMILVNTHYKTNYQLRRMSLRSVVTIHHVTRGALSIPLQ